MSIANSVTATTIALTDTLAEIVPAPAAGKLHVVKSVQFTNVTVGDTDAIVTGALKDDATVLPAFLHSCIVTKSQNSISGFVDGNFTLSGALSIVARAEAASTASVTVCYLEIDA